MKNVISPRSRTVVSGLLAAAVTTVLVSSLVESFDPVQLLRLEEQTAPGQIAAVDARKEAQLIRKA